MDKSKSLEIAGWKKSSCADGPGMRSVLFLQGCSMHCPGCQNKSAQKKGGGEQWDVCEIAGYLMQACRNKRLTISGGEPMEQWEPLRELLAFLKNEGFDLCIYTGWGVSRLPREVFALVDYVKCGSFMAELGSDNIRYVGSSNQRMYRKSSGQWEELDLHMGA